MPGVQVNKADLAHIFGVDQPTIDNWLGRGLPHMHRRVRAKGVNGFDREMIFDTADAINWRLTVSSVEEQW